MLYAYKIYSLTVFTIDAQTYKELMKDSFRKVKKQEKEYQE